MKVKKICCICCQSNGHNYNLSQRKCKIDLKTTWETYYKVKKYIRQKYEESLRVGGKILGCFLKVVTPGGIGPGFPVPAAAAKKVQMKYDITIQSLISLCLIMISMWLRT